MQLSTNDAMAYHAIEMVGTQRAQRVLDAWKRVVALQLRAENYEGALVGYFEDEWKDLHRRIDHRLLVHHGYATWQLLEVKGFSFSLPGIAPDPMPPSLGLPASASKRRGYLYMTQQLFASAEHALYTCRLRQLRWRFGRSARDRWRSLVEWQRARTIALFCLEETQRSLCAEGGRGRGDDIGAFLRDRDSLLN